MERPRPRRREAIPTDEQVEAMLAAARDQPFRNLIELVYRTGTRPGEVTRATAADVRFKGVTPKSIVLR